MTDQCRLMKYVIAVLTATGGIAVGSIGTAQEAITPPIKSIQNSQVQRVDDSTVINAIDDKVSGGNVRVSELIGMDIQNPAGEEIGEIDDLVIDARTGKVRYAAVTYGGFLGLGNKLFAVPFEAFRFQREPGDADDIILVLNISENQLEASQGFDKDHWPNWSDPHFARELDQRYQVDRQRVQNRGVDVQVGGGEGIDVNID